MNWNDIKSSNEVSLNKALSETRAKLVELRFKVATGALKQVHEIKKTKKIVSRILTRLNSLRSKEKSIKK